MSELNDKISANNAEVMDALEVSIADGPLAYQQYASSFAIYCLTLMIGIVLSLCFDVVKSSDPADESAFNHLLRWAGLLRTDVAYTKHIAVGVLPTLVTRGGSRFLQNAYNDMMCVGM